MSSSTDFALSNLPRYAKLPNWVKEHLDKQHRSILALQERVDVLEGAKQYEGTKVFIRSHSAPFTGDIPLPANSTIVFKVGPAAYEYIEVRQDRRGDPNRLDDSGNAVQVRAGDSAIAVVPSARNVVHVKAE
jgi:hypothetical protein